MTKKIIKGTGMKKILPLAIGISILLTGCNSTPNYRTVLEGEIPNYKQKITEFSEGKYQSYWVQPANKSEDCQVLMEGYKFEGQPWEEVSPDGMYWDGECKNGALFSLTVDHPYSKYLYGNHKGVY
jgi:hypothetical protein